MQIDKAKLVEGKFLQIIFDGAAYDDVRNYKNIEASHKLKKAFQRLNPHLCDLTEQYCKDGQPDYDWPGK